jgi:hypothetical protein
MSIVQCSCLGNFGRLGNQFFQYAFAKAYSLKYNAILEIPNNWIGRKLFNINDPSISKSLSKTELDIIPWGNVNIDLFGYFQFKDCYNLYSQQEVKTWFKFKDKWLNLFPKKESYIACHLRRGDYEDTYSGIYCIITQKSYILACKKFNLDINKVIWVSEENKKNNIECDKENIPFLPDFMTLYNADILIRANSCFSLWAGILSDKEVYSPIVVGKTGSHDVEFVKGNEEMIVSDYQGGSPQCPSKFIFK